MSRTETILEAAHNTLHEPDGMQHITRLRTVRIQEDVYKWVAGCGYESSEYNSLVTCLVFRREHEKTCCVGIDPKAVSTQTLIDIELAIRREAALHE